MTRRILDIGQNVLQSSIQTESITSHSYLGILFLIASLDEAFIRSILCINCMICINAVINNNYGELQDINLLFKITMGTRKGRAHEGGKVVSPTHRPPLPPTRYTLISVRG